MTLFLKGDKMKRHDHIGKESNSLAYLRGDKEITVDRKRFYMIPIRDKVTRKLIGWI